MYKVPDMHLIVQHRNMACWYASARMVIQWKRRHLRATLIRNPDPSQVKVAVGWEVSDLGVTNPQIIQLAQLLGLRAIPAMTPTLKYVRELLQRYGPLWTNGKSHIVVIGGVDEASGRLLVYDPWPPGIGAIGWRKFQWYLKSGAPDSRDTSPDVRAVFLYHP
jgi:ABC-type bacteriocin/lantibiotic exporter with double-glycine peptidase domain